MNTRRLELWILLADVVWIVVAFFCADLLRFGLTWTSGERIAIRALLPFVIATCATWIALSSIMEMDGFRGGWRLSAVISHLLLGLCCTLTLVTALGYFARSYVSRLALTYFTVLLACGFLGVRCGARMLLQMRHRDQDLWRVLILGSGRVAQEVAAKIQEHPEMLCKVVGLLFPNESAGDLLTTLDFSQLVRFHYENRAMATIGTKRRTETVQFGVIEKAANGRCQQNGPAGSDSEPAPVRRTFSSSVDRGCIG